MANKCCYYERGDERYHACTTDDNCPDMGESWTFISSWGVENCEDCTGTDPTPPKGRQIDHDLIDKIRRKLRDLKIDIDDLFERFPEGPPDPGPRKLIDK